MGHNARLADKKKILRITFFIKYNKEMRVWKWSQMTLASLNDVDIFVQLFVGEDAAGP